MRIRELFEDADDEQPNATATGDEARGEEGEESHAHRLIPFPPGTTKVKVSDVYDWYKLGMVISDLDDADPKMFGQGAPQTMIAFGSEEEEAKLLPLLKRLGMAVTDVDDPQVFDEAYEASSLIEKLAQRNGRWALVSKSDPKKVLQYYRGPKGERPSQDWVKDVERRVHSFEDAAGVGTITKQNQTVDVGPNEVKKQAAKWGNKVDKNGRPPLLRK
jgi:hypothetical protein